MAPRAASPISAAGPAAGTSPTAPANGERTIDKSDILGHIEGWYQLLRDAVDAADPSSIVATEAWDLEPLETWVSGRVVLIGDAAHATTPFASMGACMTIQDSASLVEHLGSDASVEDALAAFVSERKQRDEAVVRESRRMGHLSQMHSPIATWLRDEAFSHTPGRRAAGQRRVSRSAPAAQPQ
ncbi:MAG TPA: FAD-dependent monooxygenase [Solirubrobacteraceae bacterium]|nr:FAD-dependent monooxygenase [Solirubrobacteraceae bacterium]